MKVYLDNAASTPLDPVVFEEMRPYLLEQCGNPSSIHAHGRQARSAIERARKKVADLLNTSPSEVFFTSGGTEADNMALQGSVQYLGVKRVISSSIEHHAVLHTLEYLEKKGAITLDFVRLNGDGGIDYKHLEELLNQSSGVLVSLMHANNEIGNLTDLDIVGDLCEAHNAIFHTDTVQTMGHYAHDFQVSKNHFAVGSAHKFHGPKGVGFLYARHDKKIGPFIHGGAQERNMRGGTENVAGIIGLAKALELASDEREIHVKQVREIKEYMKGRLVSEIPEIAFNGLSADLDESSPTILSVSLPSSTDDEMLLFSLDIEGISVSGGSACSSGSNIGSHVLAALDRDQERGAVRFSFSKYTTREEIDFAINKLASVVKMS